ncbi:hypothetical protein B0O99DRAFT_680491 [Bisporella sp. PMI_857]|nr:hypothetical protein B0O99DRAFT_680491 [Bisporella sp. PMI_857]
MGWETIQSKQVKVTTVLGAMEVLAAEGIDELGGLFAASQSDYQRFYTYMTSTPLAHFDPKIKIAQTGMYCTGCYKACNRDLGGIRAVWVTEHRKYLKEQFLEHYKSCIEAQNLWDAYLKEEEQ